MTITHDLSEIEKAFRKALLADVNLVRLLGSNTEVWREQPRVKVNLPSIILSITSPNPAPAADTYTGEWMPEFQIDVLSDGPDGGRMIHGYLEQAWTIPQARRSAVESRWLRMDSFRPTSSLVEVGEVMLMASQQEAYLTSRIYRSRVIVARTPEDC